MNQVMSASLATRKMTKELMRCDAGRLLHGRLAVDDLHGVACQRAGPKPCVFTTPIDFTQMKLFSKWGLGQTLTREVFAIALDMELEKLMAQMTVDQRGAINVFEGLGFRAEALLKDHVKDRDGKKHDIVILSHDVARFETQMAAYGVTAAL